MIGERVVREAEVRQSTGLSRTTRWKLERAGSFPRRRQFSPGISGYLESELVEWLRSRPLRESAPVNKP